MKVVLPAVGVCVISFLYGLSSFVTSDRLSSKTRRVILPAHLALFGFYLCIVVSRIIALTLFAHAFGYFVLLFIGVHWVLSIFGVLNQRSQFCLDYAEQPRRERWWLEVPFALFAACLYQFVFFSLKEGRTRYALSVYLVVTLIENVLMVVMFFTEFPSLWYAPASVAVVIGLFLVGTLLLLVYYLLFHPDRTEDWYWIGIPKKCCGFSSRKSKSYRPHNIEISAPTLVNMNGQTTNLPGQTSQTSQTRLSGLQPITSILARGNPPGQVQLSAPPIIDSGIPSEGEEDYYKKPRVHLPQQRSSIHASSGERISTDSHSHYQVPNNLPLVPGLEPSLVSTSEESGYRTIPYRHTLDPNLANNSGSNRIQVLQIPEAPSLGSSARSDSDDLDTQGSLVPESDRTIESYVPTPSQQSMGLHMDSQVESAFRSISGDVPVSNHSLRDNANASNANHTHGNRHDHDIDSPLISPYDTLETARREAVQLQDTEAILEENEIGDNEGGEGGRYSASPPNLPTPDFTDHALIPGDHHTSHNHHHRDGQLGDERVNDIHYGPQGVQNSNPHQNYHLPPSLGTNAVPTVPPHSGTTEVFQGAQFSVPQPQGTSMTSSQLPMFQGIPAKRDYHDNQPSQLEQHYFPEPSSHSTPNLVRGPKLSGGQARGQSSPPTESFTVGPQGGSTQGRINTASTTVGIVKPPSPAKVEKSTTKVPANLAPERTRGRQRGGRGGTGNRNPQKSGKVPSQQSYYAYDSSGKAVTRQSSGRTANMRAPMVSPENRQLFGRALPPQAVGMARPSPWQQQQNKQRGVVVPVHVAAVPPPPVRNPSRSPDRTKAVQFQSTHTPVRPRSYSEGTTLESSQSQEPRSNQDNGRSPANQSLGPQYSQHFLGRSPGAPRRGDLNNSYYVPSDRTQVLNLTWTSPRLHHDPAISGQASTRHPQQRAKKVSYDASYYGGGGQSSSHAPFLKQRSQTAYELGSHGNHNPQRKSSNPGGGIGGHHHGNHMSNNAGAHHPFHVPSHGSHTSRV